MILEYLTDDIRIASNGSSNCGQGRTIVPCRTHKDNAVFYYGLVDDISDTPEIQFYYNLFYLLKY